MIYIYIQICFMCYMWGQKNDYGAGKQDSASSLGGMSDLNHVVLL